MPAADPSGKSVRRLNQIEITNAAISIGAIPLTTGVRIRRSRGSQAGSASCAIYAATKRLASVANPASATARTAIDRALKPGPAREIGALEKPWGVDQRRPPACGFEVAPSMQFFMAGDICQREHHSLDGNTDRQERRAARI